MIPVRLYIILHTHTHVVSFPPLALGKSTYFLFGAITVRRGTRAIMPRTGSQPARACVLSLSCSHPHHTIDAINTYPFSVPLSCLVLTTRSTLAAHTRARSASRLYFVSFFLFPAARFSRFFFFYDDRWLGGILHTAYVLYYKGIIYIRVYTPRAER